MEKKNDCKQVGFRLAAMLLTLILLTATLGVQPAFAGGGGNDLYVAKTGVNAGNCLITPCLTVAYAITQAGSGDRIHIAAGTYTENLTPNKILSFYGAGMNTTILDGGGLARVIDGGTFNLVIDDLTIQNGHTTSIGGGIYTTAMLSLVRVKVTGNVAQSGGGIYSSGQLTLTDSVVSNNSANINASGNGGGLFLGGAGVTVSLTGATISGNLATNYSGAIHNQGSGILNLTNVTISGNTAKIGGVMYNTNSATTNILNSTIVQNYFSDGGATGGIANYATINFKNTIIALNAGINCFNSGSLVSLGHNLDSGSTCNLTNTGDLQNTDPQIGPLADNGGPTRTRALLGATILHPRSPAIDAGTNTGCPATDQRGVSRPQGAYCDIGAFEVMIYPIYLPLILR
jgi:predicted outer membrane repeat protein